MYRIQKFVLIKRQREREEILQLKENHKILYLLMRITMVVIIAARNTKPPNTPSAIIPPEIGDHYIVTKPGFVNSKNDGKYIISLGHE